MAKIQIKIPSTTHSKQLTRAYVAATKDGKVDAAEAQVLVALAGPVPNARAADLIGRALKRAEGSEAKSTLQAAASNFEAGRKVTERLRRYLKDERINFGEARALSLAAAEHPTVFRLLKTALDHEVLEWGQGAKKTVSNALDRAAARQG